MITHRDLAGFPSATSPSHRTSSTAAPGEAEALERIAGELTERSLDRVMRVVLRLYSQASLTDPATAATLLAAADELDAAVRAARDVLFPRAHRDPPPGTVPPDGPSTQTRPDSPTSSRPNPTPRTGERP
ncbi:MAG TPA: hypothetical protein VFE65_07370 [Pseudonocardia sp.]|jgi:hypothetical protein|nr:hypothetical protein [Pseudonocardia sp.]